MSESENDSNKMKRLVTAWLDEGDACKIFEGDGMQLYYWMCQHISVLSDEDLKRVVRHPRTDHFKNEYARGELASRLHLRPEFKTWAFWIGFFATVFAAIAAWPVVRDWIWPPPPAMLQSVPVLPPETTKRPTPEAATPNASIAPLIQCAPLNAIPPKPAPPETDTRPKPLEPPKS